MKFNLTYSIGLILIVLGWLSIGCMGYLIHCGLITIQSLILCELLFCLFVISGFVICTREKNKNTEDSEDRKKEKHDESRSILSTVLCCLVCFILALLLVSLGAILDDKPDEISYGGSGHYMGSYDSDIVIYEDNGTWVMIIPDNYGEPDMNYSTYYTYHWNGTSWNIMEEE